ncbi:hypothetical protein VPH35_044670 [Triticum aestivum]
MYEPETHVACPHPDRPPLPFALPCSPSNSGRRLHGSRRGLIAMLLLCLCSRPLQPFACSELPTRGLHHACASIAFVCLRCYVSTGSFATKFIFFTSLNCAKAYPSGFAKFHHRRPFCVRQDPDRKYDYSH